MTCPLTLKLDSHYRHTQGSLTDLSLYGNCTLKDHWRIVHYTLTVRSRNAHCTPTIRSRIAHGSPYTLTVLLRIAHCTMTVRSQIGHYTVTVRSWWGRIFITSYVTMHPAKYAHLQIINAYIFQRLLHVAAFSSLLWETAVYASVVGWRKRRKEE